MRIQNEISEVEKREMELRNEHAMISSPTLSPIAHNDHTKRGKVFSVLDDEPEYNSPTNIDKKDDFKKNKIIEPHPRPLQMPGTLTRALSTPSLFQKSPLNKININSPHKGIMERFIASRGKLVTNQHAIPQNNFKNNLIMVS